MVVDGRGNRHHSRHRHQQVQAHTNWELLRIGDRYITAQRRLQDQFTLAWEARQAKVTADRRHQQRRHKRERHELAVYHEDLRLALRTQLAEEIRLLRRRHIGPWLELQIDDAYASYERQKYDYEVDYKRQKREMKATHQNQIIWKMDYHQQREVELFEWYQEKVVALREEMFLEQDVVTRHWFV